MIDIEFTSAFQGVPHASVVLVDQGLGHSAALSAEQKKLIDYMAQQDFKAKYLYWRSSGLEVDNSLLYLAALGLGKAEDITAIKLQDLGGKIFAQSRCVKFAEKFSVYTHAFGEFDDAQIAAEVAYGAMLASYKFEQYKTTKTPEEEDKVEFKGIHIHILHAVRWLK